MIKMMLIIVMLLLCSCTIPIDKQLASTSASFETPDGKKINYASNKDQVGLKAKYIVGDDGKVKEVNIEVEKASTSEAAIAANLQLNLRVQDRLDKLQDQVNELLKVVLPIAKAVATKGIAP